MAKQSLQKLFGAFGSSSTRILIIDTITKSGNAIKYEDLMEKVMSERQIDRPGVRWHIRRMLERGEIEKKTDGTISLKDPVQLIPPPPSPVESWPIVGVALSMAFFLVGLLQDNLLVKLVSFVFVAYAFAIVFYLRKIRARK